MNKHNPLRVVDYLAHIIQAIQRIEEYTQNMTEVVFLKDTMAQDAVIRNLEVIGEASNNLLKYHPEFIKKYPDLPLKIAYEMRNVLSHGYFTIDLEIVWNAIEENLPELQKSVQDIYKSFV